MRPSGIVTLTTDFGLADGYVGAVKGVLLGLAPGCVVVDVSHLVARHDVVGGAFVLAQAAAHFPEGTVHLAVVDPTVGSDRAAVAVEYRGGWLVGPDNGLLTRAAGERVRAIVGIERVPGAVRAPSPTFHGRDLFAPAAAHLATGGALSDLGPPRASLAPLAGGEVERRGDLVVGRALHVDGFGNVVTSLMPADLPDPPESVVFEVGPVLIRGLVRTYADVAPGEVCVLVGSDGFLEVAVREGSAAEAFGLVRGTTVVCRATGEADGARGPGRARGGP